MYRILIIIVTLLFFNNQISSQILGIGWEQDNLHGAYRWDNSNDETMHIQPGSISFFEDITYQTSSFMDALEFRLVSPNKVMELTNDALIIYI